MPSSNIDETPEHLTREEKVVKGCHLMVACHDLGNVKAEVLQVDQRRCYVHFLEHNKRLDRWVDFDSLDLNSIDYPTREQEEPGDDKSTRPVQLPKKRRRLLRKRPTRRKVPRTDEESALSRTDRMELPVERPRGQPNHDEKNSQIKNIEMIQLGEHYVRPWYFSPYPQELSKCEVVHICEFCLSFRTSESALMRHREKCKLFHPPGSEIYRCDAISFFEVDGRQHREYSHNLCLLAKLFLDHKTLYFDTDPFLFYVLTKTDMKGSHIIGYFSKERQSKQDYNVACILVLPPYQKMGYGRILIEFSYELTKREGKQGSPEKPLSDLGLLSYCSYWSHTVLSTLLACESGNDRSGQPPRISIQQICEKTGMKKDDVVYILQQLELLYYDRGDVCILLDDELVRRHEKRGASHTLTIKQDCFFGKWKRQ